MNKKTKIIYYVLMTLSVVASVANLCWGNFAIAIWAASNSMLLYWAYMWHEISWLADKSLDEVFENYNALYYQKQVLEKENKALKTQLVEIKAQVEKMEKELHNLPYRDEKGVYRKR
jgi:cell shape-determining protein MreC